MRHVTVLFPCLQQRLRAGPTVVAASLAMLVFAFPATAARRDAALAIDANTGAVLYAQAADEPRYPASLTKMMTLYIAFSEIEAGRLSYDTPIKISEAAAAVAPSKLDLEPGSEIALIDAMKALVTKSANDVAVAIAERIAGSEDNFARLMTQRARAIGMRSTNFQNASGLPDTNQTTTARDVLTLALRIHDEFPKHYRLFSLRHFTYKGETHRNHNTLLFHYPGTEGMKTGYTRMSGFNLVTSVKRDGKHVVAAVFGGSTAGSRNAHMRSILSRSLGQASKIKTRQPAPILIAKPKKAPRPAKAVALKMEPKPALRPAPRPQQAPPTLAQAPPAPEIAMARAKPGTTATPDAAIAFATANGTWTPVVSPRPEPQNRALRQAPAPEPAAPAGRAETVISKTSRSSQVIARSPSTLGAQLASMQETSATVPQTRDPEAPMPQAWMTEPEPAGATPGPVAARQPSSLSVQAARMDAVPEQQGVTLAQHTPKPQRAAPVLRLGGPTGAIPANAEIEIGTFATAEEAESRMAAAQTKAPNLAGRTALALPVEANGAMAYRARFSGFDGAGAEAACRELVRLSISCRIARSQP